MKKTFKVTVTVDVETGDDELEPIVDEVADEVRRRLSRRTRTDWGEGRFVFDAYSAHAEAT